MRKLLVRVFSGVFAFGLIGGALAIAKADASEPTAKRFFTATQNAEIYYDYQAPAHIGDYKGIFVKAKDNGDSAVTLNYELDMRMFSAEDTFLRVLPITTSVKETKGDLEVSEITVRLTDVEDENVFVEMSVQRNVDALYPYASYARARGNGQLLTGRHFNDKDVLTYHSDNNYGREVKTNFYGRARTGVSIANDIKAMTFAYDYDTSCVHTDASVPHAYKDTIIADLTDSVNMKGTWTGFKSGKVKMSIIASSENFSNKDAGFMILNFGGLDFSQSGWEDAETPFFKVDTLGYNENALPEAEVFTRYPVYQAMAFDKYDGVYGLGTAERPVDITVRKEGSSVPISVQDNYFVPMETGVYEICYTASDTTGNVAQKILKIKTNTANSITHAFASPIDTMATVGVKTLLPEHEVGGVYGEYSISTKVYENVTGEEIAIKNGGFLTQREGVYTVFVEVEDFLGRSAQFNYYVTAKSIKTPILETTPTIPALMILGKEVSLPDFDAFDYYSITGQKTEAEKYFIIKNADGEELARVKPNEKFTPDATFGERITIEYVAKSYLYEEMIGGQSSVVILDKQGAVDFSNYFVAQNTVGEPQGNYSGESCIAYFFNDDSAKISYGIPLLFNGMNFSFRVPQEKNNYQKIIVTLTDSALSSRQVQFIIERTEDKDFSDFYLNGEKIGKMYGTFDDTKLEDFLLKINGRNELIDEKGNFVCQITNYLSGEEFEGFSDNICYAEFTFQNVIGESAIQFVKSGRQYFDVNTKQDYIEPSVALYGEYHSEQTVGEITLPGAIAVDAICGRTDVYLEVYTEDYELVYRTKIGTDSVSFTIKKSGKYTVKYVSKDDSYNSGALECVLSVYLVEPFEVSILGTVATTAKQGDTISLPKFSVDSKIEAYDAVVFVIKPKGGKIEVTESLLFVADQVGMYKVYYYVVYEVENSYLYNLIEYVIQVN